MPQAGKAGHVVHVPLLQYCLLGQLQPERHAGSGGQSVHTLLTQDCPDGQLPQLMVLPQLLR